MEFLTELWIIGTEAGFWSTCALTLTLALHTILSFF